MTLTSVKVQSQNLYMYGPASFDDPSDNNSDIVSAGYPSADLRINRMLDPYVTAYDSLDKTEFKYHKRTGKLVGAVAGLFTGGIATGMSIDGKIKFCFKPKCIDGLHNSVKIAIGAMAGSAIGALIGGSFLTGRKNRSQIEISADQVATEPFSLNFKPSVVISIPLSRKQPSGSHK